MSIQSIHFSWQVFESLEQVPANLQPLIIQAREQTKISYAPYSHFHVGAVALLNNGEIIKGTNQENASYPIGICAERTLLSAAATVFPEVGIKVMAISYFNHRPNERSDTPISPCGMCRQAMFEFEERTSTPIQILLTGQSGQIYLINRAADLLPLAFSGAVLKD
ncbi:MAG: cytidine deaminase [Chitinophagaceae bacterium]|uniref:cytidine deaminase n=1 Tax=unclassified Paraflavitalea TaxID=2798305 RepID=UPI003D3453CB|nr:cytidine deaminase [Chitinophagaceae bacterium]